MSIAPNPSETSRLVDTRSSSYVPPTPPITPPGTSPILPIPALCLSPASTGKEPSADPLDTPPVSRPITPARTPSPVSQERTFGLTLGIPSARPSTIRSHSSPFLDSIMPTRRSLANPVSGLRAMSPPLRSPSALLPRLVDPSEPSTSWPRRRVSLSVNGSPNTLPGPLLANPHPYPQPHTISHTHGRHHPHTRRRARTLSFPVRTSKHVPPSRRLFRSRRNVLTILILLSLFLVGTVIVLSSVSYYLALPAWAFLSEAEVPWRPSDAIKPLKYSPPGTARHQKREPQLSPEEEATLPEPIEEWPMDPESLWDVDGEGSGSYWMEKSWDGHVEGTEDWTRLYNVTARPGERMPRLIHQTWKDDTLPLKWRKAFKECREGMQDYELMLWTDATSREFIKTNYPAHLHMYDSYKYPIQRADSIRYFVLHHFGGIYMDLDIGCRRRLDPLLQGDWDVILPVTKPVGVSNDLILSSKGSAFIDDTIHALPAWNHEWVSNYPTVMFSTGPMFLSAQYAIYSSAHPITSGHPRSEVRILPKSLYGKNAVVDSVPHSFFSHFYGSSWHSDDAGFIAFLGKRGKTLMWVGSVVVIAGLLRILYLKVRGVRDPRYQLLSVLPTSSGADASATISSGIEAISSQHLPQDIASTLKRAGNLILAAPATLLSGDRRNRRRTGLLYFVPALFQPGPVTTRRGRTASEASQLPLRRSRKDRERERLLPPPAYTEKNIIHDEPDSMDDESTPTLPRDGFPGRNSYPGYLRDIESGSSSATDGEDGPASPVEGEWRDWGNKEARG